MNVSRFNNVLKKIKEYCEYYPNYSEEPYLVFENLTDDDLIILDKIGFGIFIYDDSNEYSDYFDDSYRISWRWTV